MYKRFVTHVLRLVLIAMLVVIVGWLVIVPVYINRLFATDLPTKESIMRWNSRGIVLTDRAGQPFFTLYRTRPEVFRPLHSIASPLKQAIILMEDRDFYSHSGFSFRAMARSFLANLKQGSLSYGGSTITQQLAKNTLLTPTKSFWRKYEELIIASEIERRYSKDEILEMYLNSVYFGQGAFGAEAAARAYFNKSADELTIGESAFLTGLLPSPSSLSKDSTRARQRQKLVLQTMYTAHLISAEDIKSGLQTSVAVKSNEEEINHTAPHFAIMVKQLLLSQFDEDTLIKSGWQVRTTLDLNMQRYAEESVTRQVGLLRPNQTHNGAAVVIDPTTGEVLSVVGSVDWNNEQFGKVNMATSPRQTGSAFKPIVYAAAFEQRSVTPATILHDVPRTFGKDYRPQNFEKRFRGNVPARRALALSLNIPAVEVADRIGVSSIVSLAQKLGITTISPDASYNLSTALGANEVSLYELTSAYGALAHQGIWIEPSLILHISDKSNHIFSLSKPHTQVALSPQTAYLISSILSDTKARADVFRKTLTISHLAAVKTGTTNSYRDAWTVGYTPDLVVGVWVGNNDNTPMDRVAGSLGAAPIWRNLMEHFLEQHVVQEFQRPWGIVSRRACGGYEEFFISGTETRQKCPTSSPQPSVSPTLSPTALPSKNTPATSSRR